VRKRTTACTCRNKKFERHWKNRGGVLMMTGSGVREGYGVCRELDVDYAAYPPRARKTGEFWASYL
jgi:hypothetical protein